MIPTNSLFAGHVRRGSFIVVIAGLLAACNPSYDVILRDGTIYDGSGEASYVGDVAISGDKIVAIGDIGGASALIEIDAVAVLD